MEYADIIVRYVPGYGYLTIVEIDNKEIYRSGDFFPLAINAYERGIEKLPELMASPATT
jgi:hypothetical protein